MEEGLNEADQINRFKVESLGHDEFQNAIKALEQRRIDFRNNKDIYLEESPKMAWKKLTMPQFFSLITIYYALKIWKRKKKRKFFTGSLTGEIVAYLVRCFSKCKLIVGLNQYGSNPFDLTLKGDLDSFADLNLGDQQLDNPNLWKSDSREEYRPWSWPNLSNSIHDFDRRIREVQEKLNKPICDVLGFDPDAFQLLPREIEQFIGKYEKKETVQTTFRSL